VKYLGQGNISDDDSEIIAKTIKASLSALGNLDDKSLLKKLIDLPGNISDIRDLLRFLNPKMIYTPAQISSLNSSWVAY